MHPAVHDWPRLHSKFGYETCSNCIESKKMIMANAIRIPVADCKSIYNVDDVQGRVMLSVRLRSGAISAMRRLCGAIIFIATRQSRKIGF